MTPLLLAFLVDLIIGDPRWLPHPVVVIGRLITFLEHHIRKISKSPNAEIFLGGILVLFVVGITYLISLIFTNIVERFNHIHLIFGITLSDILIGIIGSFALSTKGLCSHVMKVIDRLNNLDDARKALSQIVGRDTKNLDREAILRATIETLSENTSDGIIAPMFYFAIGGLPLAFAYKAINTLDSMIGYKNERYLFFGRIAAKTDDVVNFIPARITGILLIISALILKIIYSDINPIRGLKIMFRDGQKHTSPNAALPEAAIAGIFGIRLGGASFYGGQLFDKPFIGDEIAAIDEKMILKTVNIVKMSALIFVLICTCQDLV